MKKPNMNGIIHSSMRLVDCWRGSALRGELIFCITHMEPPTSTANKYMPNEAPKNESGDVDKSSPKNMLFKGTTWCTADSHGYR